MSKLTRTEMGLATKTIKIDEYKALLKEHYPNGNVPMTVVPLAPRPTQEPRVFQCAHCAYAASANHSLVRHEREVHGVNLVWHACTQLKPDGTPCNYKGKSTDDVRQHMRKFHNIGVRWHVCGQPGCAYMAKTAGDLKKHKANRHDIDVVWYRCQVPDCTFVCKQRNSLNQHARWMHSGRPLTYPKRADLNRVSPELQAIYDAAVEEVAYREKATACVPCAEA